MANKRAVLEARVFTFCREKENHTRCILAGTCFTAAIPALMSAITSAGALLAGSRGPGEVGESAPEKPPCLRGLTRRALSHPSDSGQV